jgi:hypothetical protein
MNINQTISTKGRGEREKEWGWGGERERERERNSHLSTCTGLFLQLSEAINPQASDWVQPCQLLMAGKG